jgi:hypothetical protein
MAEEFWMVWRDNGSLPSYKHQYEQGAREEAERLARLNRGVKFHVLKSIASVTEPLPPLTWETAQDDLLNVEVPF